MPGASNPRVVEFTPNRGLISNQSSHDADASSWTRYENVFNDLAGRIRKRPGIGSAVGSAASGKISALHEFLRVNPSTGAETLYKFRTFGNTVQRWTGASWSTENLPYTPTGSAPAWGFWNHENRCWLFNGADELLYFDGTTGPDGRNWYIAGVDEPTVAAGYSLGGIVSGTVTCLEGGKLVTTSAAVVTNDWNGKFIDIDGIRYEIDAMVTSSTFNLVENFKEASSVYTYVAYVGLMDWDEPPLYSYSYRNSTTGHTSNRAPLTEITEKDQVGVTPQITAIPYSASAYLNGYDEIVIFRTPKNGSTLVEVTAIANANSGATTSYSETSATNKDSDLSKNEAPLTLNGKPPLGISSVGSWVDRLWFLVPREGRLYYSAAPEDLVNTLGSPAECAPAKYNKQVRQGKALLPIGVGDEIDRLVIQTGAGDYTVVGQSYPYFQIRKMPTREVPGFRGGAISVGGSLVQFYADKRLIDFSSSSDIGVVIQDKLNAIPDVHLNKARLLWFSFQSRNFLLLSVTSSGSSDNDRTFVFDLDAGQVWYEWAVGFSALAIMRDATTGALELWAGNSVGAVYRLLTSTFVDAGTNVVPVIESAWIRPFGAGVRADLAFAEVFVSDRAQSWTGEVLIDEESAVSGTSKSKAITFSLPSFEHDDSPSVLKLNDEKILEGKAFKLKITFPDTANDVYIEKIRLVFRPRQEVEQTL